MLNVKITIDDGNGKKAEISISEADNLSKLVIIKNVFELFGVDSDIMEMANTYSKIGEAYSNFFNEVEPLEIEALEKTDKNKNEIKEQFEKAYIENKTDIENTYVERNDQPEFVRTGIKIRDDGTKTYRLYYKCPACYNKGTHYIYEDSKRTWCHRCQHDMLVSQANPEGHLVQDTFGNFFKAGDFQDWNVWNSNDPRRN